jgi:NADH-quinone oxidoreductase subunit A
MRQHKTTLDLLCDRQSVAFFKNPRPQWCGFFSTHFPDPPLQPLRKHADFMPEDFLPVLFQVLIALGFAVSTLSLSIVFGRSAKRTAIKDTAYECGMLPIGDGAPRFSVKFYLVAMLFVIFDIEVVFMYPWAVQFRDLASEGATALVSMAGFAGILVFAYVYALKKGALNWKS